jgi:hypothetical protein
MNRRQTIAVAAVFLIGVLLFALAAITGPAVAHAADPNPNCSLVVPEHPASARGLATPYKLKATDREAGPCSELNVDQAAFVEAAILDPASGHVSVYHPLVVDRGTHPAVRPVPVHLPRHAVVGIWFGSNGDTLKLTGEGAGDCVNGRGHSLFGQYAYCNAPAFFRAANRAVQAGTLVPPPLGVGRDHLPCPTVRDFSVVDQDQSDNVATVYRIVGGRLAQDTAATRAGTKLANGSDERLLAEFIDPALGCSPWKAPDVTDGGALVSSLALNELHAALTQAAPQALVPLSDPMVLVGGHQSVRKTNLYRAGVDQPRLPAGQSPADYCSHLVSAYTARMVVDRPLFAASAGPTGDLAGFLDARLANSITELGCPTP